jgi:DNA-binding transcriptional LysR family regulator
MELRQLRYFVEIAEHASFTRAAEALSIAQPALSAQMHKLEAEFGAPLFVRTRRGTELTDVGRAALDQARTTLASAEATKRTARLAAELDGATVRVAYSRIYPIAQLARLIRGFRRERPNVHLDLREMWSTEQDEAVATGAVDFGFRQIDDEDAERLEDRGLVYIPLATESLTLAVPSSHRLASRRSVALAELAGEPFVLPGPTAGETIRGSVLAKLRALGITPNVVQATTDARLSLGLVSAEMGVTLVLSGNRNLRVRNVHYLSIVPANLFGFGVVYRRGYGGRSIEPFLRRIEREELV